MVGSTSSWSRNEARATKITPSGKCSRNVSATAMARLDLPTPPALVRVRMRTSGRSSILVTASRSCSRPTRGAGSGGGRSGTGRSGTGVPAVVAPAANWARSSGPKPSASASRPAVKARGRLRRPASKAAAVSALRPARWASASWDIHALIRRRRSSAPNAVSSADVTWPSYLQMPGSVRRCQWPPRGT